MKKRILCVFTIMAAVCAVLTLPLAAQENSGGEVKINWVYGPATANMNGIAEIKIPDKYRFANGDDTRKIMELYGNPPTDLETGYIEPERRDWFIVFEFDETGYIKDDEKNSLDADAILKSIKEGTKESNKWRKEKGMPDLAIIGWQKKPSYNTATNNLEWAIINESAGSRNINYNIRFLGRKGVMSVIIVADEKGLNSAVAAANKMLTTYSFTEGNKYSEFTKGDKIAEYGLAALIAGGAGAAALKTGLLQKFWKFIVAGLVAAGAGIKRLFSGKKSSGEVVKQEDDKTENS
ncbi:MAG TPA: DUF2167 domain-containing protein [Spirochaetota bacterium]|nr:DUF2167 domain-containing protein [Spirochaetota bacterium]